MKVYKIFPPIGIARMGEGEEPAHDWFLGPEAPGMVPPPALGKRPMSKGDTTARAGIPLAVSACGTIPTTECSFCTLTSGRQEPIPKIRLALGGAVSGCLSAKKKKCSAISAATTASARKKRLVLKSQIIFSS